MDFQGPRMGALRRLERSSIMPAIFMEQLRSAASFHTVRRAWCSRSHRRLVAFPPFRKGGEKDGAPGSVGGEVKCNMATESQFKQVKGPDGSFESICMTCLLAVGICPSEEELVTRENEHVCNGGAEQIGLQIAKCYTAEIVVGLGLKPTHRNPPRRRLAQNYLQGEFEWIWERVLEN